MKISEQNNVRIRISSVLIAYRVIPTKSGWLDSLYIHAVKVLHIASRNITNVIIIIIIIPPLSSLTLSIVVFIFIIANTTVIMCGCNSYLLVTSHNTVHVGGEGGGVGMGVGLLAALQLLCCNHVSSIFSGTNLLFA